jgi:hypothetical protein
MAFIIPLDHEKAQYYQKITQNTFDEVYNHFKDNKEYFFEKKKIFPFQKFIKN